MMHPMLRIGRAALSARTHGVVPFTPAAQDRWWALLCGASIPLCTTTAAICEGRREASTDADTESVGLLDKLLRDERLAKWSAVSKSMQACLQFVGPWSLGDVAFGLRAVAEKHAHDEVEDALEGKPVTCRESVERLLEEVWIAEAVHQDDADAMAKMCVLQRSNIIKFDAEADHFRTAFAIALWPARKEVVLVVRGTTSLSEALTDLSGHLVPFDGTRRAEDSISSDAAASSNDSESSNSSEDEGKAHHGILRAAQTLVESQADTLAELLKDNPGYSLEVIGHSLGAGTAALAAILIQNDPEIRKRMGSPQVSCVAFATPPVVSRELAVGCRDYVTTVVNRHDIVPRASLAGFETLRTEMLATKWEESLQEEFGAKRALELATNARASLEDALEDAGIKAGSEQATRAVVSAWAGAKGAVLARLGKDAAESAEVGAAVGAGVERAREEANDGHNSNSNHEQQSGPQDTPEEAPNIPRLHAPGQLLYLSQSKDGKTVQLIEASPPDRRLQRIVLNEGMIDDHRCTAYIDAIEKVLRGLKQE